MFCDYCGAELTRGTAACISCGRAPARYRALPPALALENLRRQWISYCRVRLYGGLLITLQILGWLYALDSERRAIDRGEIRRGAPLHDPGLLKIALAVLFFVAVLGIVWAIVGFIGARALAENSTAGRRLASLMATVLLLDVPFGTVFAILVLRAIARIEASPPGAASNQA